MPIARRRRYRVLPVALLVVVGRTILVSAMAWAMAQFALAQYPS